MEDSAQCREEPSQLACQPVCLSARLLTPIAGRSPSAESQKCLGGLKSGSAATRRRSVRYDVPAPMPMNRVAAVSAVLWMASACGNAVPTAPNAPSSGRGLALVCSTPTLLAGDVVVCMATAASANVSFDAAWTSSEPAIARSEGFGLFSGRTEGQASLTATYQGKSVSQPLAVHLQDVVRTTAAAYQGSFVAGTTATLWLQGFYGVASADTGTLTLVVADQTGATVSTSAPQTVPRGGDRYIMSTTFTIPSGTTRVCRTAVLRIGSTTMTAVPDVSLVPCFAVTP